ncbi:MAG: hypothetical protein DHS20C14_04340 [Phycisphaeraceae bacterium]|nr:MAG: hypothetical protein DHS20C14_04340 [Phycisphaeraceae bacterium]
MTHASIGAGCAALVAMTLATHAHAGDVQFYFAAGGSGTPVFYTGSLSDGIAHAVGPTTLTGNTTGGMDFRGDGRLFATDINVFPGTVHEVDPLTGQSTQLFAVTHPGLFYVEGITFGLADEAYIWADTAPSFDVLLTYDLETGNVLNQVEVTYLNPALIDFAAAATTVRDDGMVIMISNTGALIEVDPFTGNALIIDNLNVGSLVRGAASLDGVTYVLDDDGTVYTVNLYTGHSPVLTTLTNFPSGNVFNFAVIPAPAGTGVLAVFGLLASRRRR